MENKNVEICFPPAPDSLLIVCGCVCVIFILSLLFTALPLFTSDGFLFDEHALGTEGKLPLR